MNFSAVRKNTAKLGRRGEDAACEYLRYLGMTILCRNYRIRAGELDIVAFDNEFVRFVEVKSLRNSSDFSPLINLSAHQRQRNFRAGKLYMKVHSITGFPGRFDLITVKFDRFRVAGLHHYPDYLPQIPPVEN